MTENGSERDRRKSTGNVERMEDMDWQRMWKEARLRSTWRKVHGNRDNIEYWNRRAESFERNTRDERGGEMVRDMIERFGIDVNRTVLDVGGGTGRLAIPLSRSAGSVTVVEPSKAMADILRSKIKEKGIQNIHLVQKRWEDVQKEKDVGRHYLTLASHSLGMMDIEEALRKMDALAEGYVCIYTFGRTRIWDFAELWPGLYGEKFVPGPSHIYLVNILYQMGISANVEVGKRKIERRYSTMKEALKETKARLDIVHGDKDGIILEYLRKSLREEGGELVADHDFEEVAIWWRK